MRAGMYREKGCSLGILGEFGKWICPFHRRTWYVTSVPVHAVVCVCICVCLSWHEPVQAVLIKRLSCGKERSRQSVSDFGRTIVKRWSIWLYQEILTLSCLAGLFLFHWSLFYILQSTRCRPGYIGPLCQHLDPCHRSPCLNGAACKSQVANGIPQYTCVCQRGFRGKPNRKCVFKIKDCMLHCNKHPYSIWVGKSAPLFYVLSKILH